MTVVLFKSGIPRFCKMKKIKSCLLKKDGVKSEYGLRNVSKAACIPWKGILFREQSSEGRLWFHELVQYPNCFCCMDQKAKSLGDLKHRQKDGASKLTRPIATRYLFSCTKLSSGFKDIFIVCDTWGLNFPQLWQYLQSQY